MTEGVTVEVRYTCRACRITDRSLPVRERNADEDIGAWVEMIRYTVSEDHNRTSPKCAADWLALKIPVARAPNSRIGDAERH